MRLALFLKKIFKNKLAKIGSIVVISLFIVSWLAPFISPHDPDQLEVRSRFKPPGTANHLLGTDSLGRDVLSRMIWGSRISLKVGFVAVGISTLIGVILGALAG
ncbi:MAG: peptide ABC transporter permease, partial [Deltaproteobacteria bacterium]|nr:peptide ABC transporter permease [Deltaproteobacteria bacterium]